jgi:phage terminase Nu1 subunit (DNA packaging protein)
MQTWRMMIDAIVRTGELARLFDTTPKTISTLGKKGIIVPAGKRGRWRLEASVRSYVQHLRAEAAGRGGEEAAQARARLGQAQAALAEAKAAQLRSELVETDAVEKLWTSKLRAFRNRILGIPGRVQYLSARQTVVLMQELRAALDELADEAG